MKIKGCASCWEKYRERLLRPFCSIVCRTLGQAGFGWRLNPCRIVDLASGLVISAGPRFDLAPRGLAQLQKQAKGLRQTANLQATFMPTKPMPQALSQSPVLESTYTGGFL